jgi:hypothetical protein
MKTLFITLFAFFIGYAHADELQWNCFVSVGEAKPIYLAFAFANDKSTDAYVRYKKGSGVILLKQTSHESVEMAEGRPFENTYEYIEKLDGADGGKYKVIVQGAIFYGFSYQSNRREKSYEFEMLSSEEHSNCFHQ